MLQWIEHHQKLLLVLIVVISAVAYLPSLFNGYTAWDDPHHIILNEDIKSLSPQNILKMFRSYYVGMYHPLTTLSFALNYHFTGLNPFYYHLTNYIFHIVNILLVYFVIRKIQPRPFVALFSALILGIHPMHVESVAWITERKDVLYAFFFLLSLLWYLQYHSTQKKTWLWLSIGAFLCSLLSKSAAVILPIILFLIDWYQHRKWSKDVLEKIPYLALSLLFGIISLISQHAGNHPHFHQDFTLLDRPFLTCYAFSYYCIKYFLPTSLSAIHPFPTKLGNLLPTEYYLSPLFVIIVIAFLWKRWQCSREYQFGLFFFITTIILVLQIFPLGYAVVAERYTYIPYLGISFFVGTIFDTVMQKNKYLQRIILILPIFITILFGVETHQRTKVWKDTFTLFTDASIKSPTEYGRNNMLAFAYKLEGDLQLALNKYKTTIDLLDLSLQHNNQISEVYIERGFAYWKLGDTTAAVKDYLSAIELDPKVPQYYQQLGTIYLRTREFDKAIESFTSAINLNPKDETYYHERGIAYLRSQQYEKALSDFNTAIQLKPTWGKAYANRGIVFYQLGKREQSCDDFKNALALGFSEAQPLIDSYCH